MENLETVFNPAQKLPFGRCSEVSRGVGDLRKGLQWLIQRPNHHATMIGHNSQWLLFKIEKMGHKFCCWFVLICDMTWLVMNGSWKFVSNWVLSVQTYTSQSNSWQIKMMSQIWKLRRSSSLSPTPYHIFLFIWKIASLLIITSPHNAKY